MRAFGVDISRSRDLAASVPQGSVGVDGQSPFADIVAGGFDRTPEMSGQRKWLTINEMRQTDAMIRSILFMFYLPLKSADHGVEANDDDPTGIVRDAVAKQFGLEDYPGELDLSWLEWMQQTLLYIPLGALGEEYVYSATMELWDLGMGDDDKPRAPIVVRPIAQMAPRFPSTVDKITVKNGRLQMIRQGLIGNGLEIPAEFQGVKKLEWYVHEREGANWWGTSLLRAMYGPWRLKKSLMIAAAIGWDRYSSGVPVVRYPKGGGARAKREAAEAARNYRTHERAWITFEGTAAEGWGLEIMGGSQTLADPTPLITLYNEEMATAALQIFSRLGSGAKATGSRALGQVLADPYYLALASYAKDLVAYRMRGPFRAFVDINFGPQQKVPILHISKIQPHSIQQLAAAIAALAAAGLNFTDRDTQNDLRDQMDLRHLPEPLARVIADLPDDIGIEQTDTGDDPFDVPAPGVATLKAGQEGYVANEGDSLGH